MNTEFNEFQKSFTDVQKAAIIGSLVIVAKSDGDLHDKEWTHIMETSKMLGMDLEISSSASKLAKMAESGLDYMLSVLRSLSRSQKEWCILAMHMTMLADGKVLHAEINFCLGIAEDMGISPDEYKRIIDKAQQVTNAFI